MLRLDVQQFAEAANWRLLPEEIHAADLASTVSDDGFPGVILPASDTEGTVCWYVATETPHDWRTLRRLLLAYVGPTISDFDGRTIRLDQENPVERCLAAAGAKNVARIRTPSTLMAHAARGLRRLIETHRRRPTRARDLPRSTQQIIASMEASLVAGDRTGAEHLLLQLDAEWRLDALNLRFIKVRILAHFRDWNAIADADWLAPLCYVRKPSPVALAILEALYRSKLESLEGDKGAQRTRYQADVRRFACPLFAQVAPSAPQLQWYSSLDELPKQTISADPVTATQQKILSAAETESVLVQRAALDDLDQLDIAEQRRTLDSAPVRDALTLVRPSPEDLAPPTNWLEWLSTLGHPSSRSIDWATTGAAEWSPGEWADPVLAESLAGFLLAVPEGLALQRFALSLPTLVRWVKSDALFPQPALRPVYDALLTQLVMMEARGQPEREAASDLFEALLSIGLSTAQYTRLLDDMGSLIDPGLGKSVIYWSFDLADLLVRYSAPNSEARLLMFGRILSGVQSCISALTPAQRVAYAHVASLAGWPALPEAGSKTGDSSIADSLAGKTIAIYTLTESAARQAEAVLQQLAPAARIELAHDHVASPRLERLAKTADHFVMVAASAKHSAFDCITRHRGARPLLYAVGRGFCSIVRAIEGACTGTV